ncbi:MAG: hypothetical protein ACU0DH_08680, partial [Paracoccus sp. (in: a-proteobacteria)]
VTLLKGAGMGLHRRPEIAGFLAKAYETLQSKAGRTEASPQKINAVEVVHSRVDSFTSEPYNDATWNLRRGASFVMLMTLRRPGVGEPIQAEADHAASE